MTRDHVSWSTRQVAVFFLLLLPTTFGIILASALVLAAPSIALATDKPLYERGEGVFFFGRGYRYPNLTLIFWLVIDENLGGGYVQNHCLCPLQAYPPEWSFAIGWKPPGLVGNFSAYMIGPNHTLSPTIKFRIIEPIPIPEFSLDPALRNTTATLVMIAAIVTIGATRRRRS